MASASGALKRAQSSFEYLTTYGWALIVVVVVLSVLFYLGVFSPQRIAPSSCTLQSGMTCYGYKVNSNGTFYLDIGQSVGKTIHVTGYSCSSASSPSVNTLGAEVTIQHGSHAVITPAGAVCVREDDSTTAAGEYYRGKLVITYHEEGSTFNHVAKGDIATAQDPY